MSCEGGGRFFPSHSQCGGSEKRRALESFGTSFLRKALQAVTGDCARRLLSVGMDGKNFGSGQQAQQNKPEAVTDNVPGDQGAIKQFADSGIGNTSPVNGPESVDMNMEAAISAEDVIRAGGFGAKDDIGSFLPAAMDSTDFEASLRDARDFEGEKEQPSHPGLGYRTNKTDEGSKPSDVPH